MLEPNISLESADQTAWRVNTTTCLDTDSTYKMKSHKNYFKKMLGVNTQKVNTKELFGR